MTGFDDREKSFERKFELDQELAFKVKARRNKLLALWAAERMGLTGDAAEKYARAIVGLRHHGDNELVAHILQDAAQKGITLDSARLRAELARAATEAKRQFGAPT